MRPELLKGHLDTLLLAVLDPGPQHGYAIIESLRSGSDGALDLPTGTVYPALHRLERAGLIASGWPSAGGRRAPPPHRPAPAGTLPVSPPGPANPPAAAPAAPTPSPRPGSPRSASNAPCGTSSPP